MTARLSSRCPVCRKPIAPGTKIEKDRRSGRYAHEGCAVQASIYRPNARPELQAQAMPCTICGEYKRGGEIITTCGRDRDMNPYQPLAHYACLKEAGWAVDPTDPRGQRWVKLAA